MTGRDPAAALDTSQVTGVQMGLRVPGLSLALCGAAWGGGGVT